jgi:hypothetical protein
MGRGHPARMIVDLAQKIGADLMVIGPAGHTALYARLIGSRADRIVQLAPLRCWSPNERCSAKDSGSAKATVNHWAGMAGLPGLTCGNLGLRGSSSTAGASSRRVFLPGLWQKTLV